MADNRTARHDRCVFCAVVFGFVFSLAGTGPVRKVYVPDPARISISHFKIVRLPRLVSWLNLFDRSMYKCKNIGIVTVV